MIVVSADYLTRDFYVFCSDGKEIKDISDNYFDILPGKSYQIRFPKWKNRACREFKYLSLNEVMIQKRDQDKIT